MNILKNLLLRMEKMINSYNTAISSTSASKKDKPRSKNLLESANFYTLYINLSTEKKKVPLIQSQWYMDKLKK